MVFSSRANQASTNVAMNQTSSSIAVMTRFLRQYSWCFAVSSMDSPLGRLLLIIVSRYLQNTYAAAQYQSW